MFKNCILRDEDGFDCKLRYQKDCGHPKCAYYFKGNWFLNLIFGAIWGLIWGIALVVCFVFTLVEVLFGFEPK